MSNWETLGAQVQSISKSDFVQKHPYPFVVVHTMMDEAPNAFKTVAMPGDAGAVEEDIFPLVKRVGANTFSFITLGRSRNNDLVVNGGAVSKLHAVFQQTKDGFTIMDSGSSNGTTLNGTPLLPQKPAKLKDGDVIVFAGQVSTKFLEAGSAYQALLNKQYH